MAANLEQFTRELDQLLGLRSGPVTASNPALQTATVLLALDLEAESTPPVDLRARWVSRTQLSVSSERKSFMTTLRTRPFAAVLIALLILLALSGVAYAVGRSLGYYPGLGVVDQYAPFYILEKPVSQTRDGITVTVEKAVINVDQAYIAFTIEGVPPEKTSFLQVPDMDICISNPELRFPDGSSVRSSGGGGVSRLLDTGYESRVKYAPIPLGVTDAALFIPCIQGAMAPGILPEDWEVPLHFIPAPPDAALSVIPVIESSPAMTPQDRAPAVPPAGITSLPEADPAPRTRLEVIQVIDTGDSYVLVGAFTPPAPPVNEKGIYAIVDIVLHDGNDQVVADEEFPFDLDLTPYIIASPGRDVWAVKFTKNFVPPLRIAYQTQYIYSPMPQEPHAFEFDAGQNPQTGQEWNLNHEFQVAGHMVTLTRITSGVNSLTFFFHTEDESVESLGMDSSDAIQIEGYTPIDFGGSFGIGSWSLTKTYPEMPKGILKVSLSGLYLYGGIEDWTMDWQP